MGFEARTLPRKIRQLKADLRRAGFYEDRTSGSHAIWKHPLIPGISANLAGSDGDDAKRYQEQEVRLAIQAARTAQEEG